MYVPPTWGGEQHPLSLYRLAPINNPRRDLTAAEGAFKLTMSAPQLRPIGDQNLCLGDLGDKGKVPSRDVWGIKNDAARNSVELDQRRRRCELIDGCQQHRTIAKLNRGLIQH
jgi:hypothetical protein